MFVEQETLADAVMAKVAAIGGVAEPVCEQVRSGSQANESVG
ncbi:MAG: hypothetical protein V2A76_18205 [Planctomycetota bacterium]